MTDLKNTITLENSDFNIEQDINSKISNTNIIDQITMENPFVKKKNSLKSNNQKNAKNAIKNHSLTNIKNSDTSLNNNNQNAISTQANTYIDTQSITQPIIQNTNNPANITNSLVGLNFMASVRSPTMESSKQNMGNLRKSSANDISDIDDYNQYAEVKSIEKYIPIKKLNLKDTV